MTSLRGPAPKDPSQRARTNPDTHPETFIDFKAARQPALPPGRNWCERTRTWWRKWGAAPQAELFTATDWESLLETAVIHNRFWSGVGDEKLAVELRRRVAQFGATPEDRLRLRWRWADVDKDEEKPKDKPAAKQRYAGLKVIRADKKAAGA